MTVKELKEIINKAPDYALVYLHSPVQGDCANVVTAPNNIIFYDDILPGIVISV